MGPSSRLRRALCRGHAGGASARSNQGGGRHDTVTRTLRRRREQGATVKKPQSMSSRKTIPLVSLDDVSSALHRVSQAADFIPLHTVAKQTPGPKQKQVELSPIHDFAAKLCQPEVIERLKEYVRWQIDWRNGYAQGATLEQALGSMPGYVPISINLERHLGFTFAVYVV